MFYGKMLDISFAVMAFLFVYPLKNNNLMLFKKICMINKGNFWKKNNQCN
jgi:hypothetical protein